MKTVLKAENITVFYGKEVILRDESFIFEGPGLVLIVGPNGAGKTTLFKAILGLVPVVNGKISANGIDITNKPEIAGKIIGYVPQTIEINSLFPISVREIVESAVVFRTPIMRLITPKKLVKKAWNAIEKLGLREVADKPLRSLSGGERQRTFIARALVWDPPIIIMDEPLAAVDPKGKSEIIDFIVKLSKDKLIVVSSHDPGLFAHYAKQVAVMNRKIIAIGAPQEVLKLDLLREIYGGGVILIRECVHVADHHAI